MHFVFSNSSLAHARIDPYIALLENVRGLLRVWPTVRRILCGKLINHIICLLRISPDEIGGLVHRERVYIIIIHKFDARLSYNLIPTIEMFLLTVQLF